MSGQGIFCHQLLSNLPRKHVLIQAPLYVNLGKLFLFELQRCLLELNQRSRREIRSLGVRLRAHGRYTRRRPST